MIYISVCTAHPGQFLTASTRDFPGPFLLPTSSPIHEVVSEQNRNKNNNDFGISGSLSEPSSLPREDLAYYSPLYQDMGTMPGYLFPRFSHPAPQSTKGSSCSQRPT